ncbi:MAG TPA: response regulator [Dongiaceae bacterium]|nr:response regulator [Dongiaceae bacterium]
MSATEPALLIVDDNENDLYVLGRRLAGYGYTKLTTASNGREAVQLLQTQPFDLVLLDIMMPEMNGFEVLERLKASPELRHLPVIMISVVDEMDSVIRCIQLGAEDYIAKPFNPTLLRARVGASLEKKRLRDELRKRTEEALREMRLQLEHANRIATMGQLTASIAHEVNQPIGASVTNAEAVLRWLDRPAPDLQEVRLALGRIVRDGARAVAVVHRIRNVIKKTPPRRERVDINSAIREVIEITRSEALKNGVSVHAELADALPAIDGDRVELQQVILNLIVNAVEAMKDMSEGARDVLITTGNSEAGDTVVSVCDSGPGLAPSIRDSLFKPFQTTKSTGMGLGLSICHSIVEAHGGRLWASPNAPQGAVFQFTLPSQSDAASVE